MAAQLRINPLLFHKAIFQEAVTLSSLGKKHQQMILPIAWLHRNFYFTFFEGADTHGELIPEWVREKQERERVRL